MRRMHFDLVAAIVEVARFVLLMFIADGLALLPTASLLAAFVRYLAAAQLLMVALFFFTWLDARRYAAYRPLLLAGSILSFLSFVPLALAIGASLRAGALRDFPPSLLPFAFAVLGAELVVLLAAALGLALQGGGSGDEESRPDAAGRASPAQHGPQDIERVEAID